jgi:protein-(glutamine-N5) methyltransferase, release factor-specific|tara:strand:- start:6 stop:848 length:843 start_codon:yes stop_codon:yes gene_type:complete
MNYNTILNEASNLLNISNIKNPRLDTELLLSNSLNISRENLLLNLNKKIKPKQYIRFIKLLEKRKKRMPMAYIVGYKEFWKTKFFINNSVLIPRPETELIVEEALNYLSNNKEKKIIDIGTGSGCIIISILKESTRSKGVALDISKNAIKIAKINAKLQQVDNRIKFINSDVDKYNHDKYDLVVSNPPYIKKIVISRLEEDVKDFEPNLALDGGNNGYLELEKVIVNSANILKKNGIFIFEIGEGQIHHVSRILLENGFYINKISKDLSKRPRCVVSTKY